MVWLQSILSVDSVVKWWRIRFRCKRSRVQSPAPARPQGFLYLNFCFVVVVFLRFSLNLIKIQWLPLITNVWVVSRYIALGHDTCTCTYRGPTYRYCINISPYCRIPIPYTAPASEPEQCELGFTFHKHKLLGIVFQWKVLFVWKSDC